MYAGVFFGCADARCLLMKLLFSLRQHGTFYFICVSFAHWGKRYTRQGHVNVGSARVADPRSHCTQGLKTDKSNDQEHDS